MILEVERQNLFVRRVGSERALRYRALFRDMLVDELHTTDRQKYRERHAAAASWWEKQGDPTQAIRHWLESEQPEAAWNVVRQHGINYYFDGRVEDFSSWIRMTEDRIPSTDVTMMVELVLSHLYVGANACADNLLYRIEGRVTDVTDTMTRGKLEYARGLSAFAQGHLVAARDRMKAAAELFEIARPGLWLRLRGPIGYMSVLSLLEQAADARAVRDIYVAGNHEQTLADAVVLPAALAEVALSEGRLHEAEIFAQSAIQRSRVAHQVSHTEVKPRYVRGVVRLERNLLEEAEQDLQIAAQLGRASGYVHHHALPTIALARVRHAEGQATVAYRMLDTLEDELLELHSAELIDRTRAVRSRLLLVHGDLALARTSIDKVTGPARQRLEAGYAALTGDRIAALSYLSQASWTSLRNEISSLLFSADCAGDVDERLGFLERALRLGEQEGYVRTFVDEAKRHDALIEKLAVHWPTPYVADVLAAMMRAPVRVKRIESLSGREREIARYLVTPLSTRQIAQRLYVSQNTAKSHIKSIYRKLGVETREQAANQLRAVEADR
jgi:LuxR family maltose regulon positive regulatory protein